MKPKFTVELLNRDGETFEIRGVTSAEMSWGPQNSVTVTYADGYGDGHDEETFTEIGLVIDSVTPIPEE